MPDQSFDIQIKAQADVSSAVDGLEKLIAKSRELAEASPSGSGEPSEFSDKVSAPMNPIADGVAAAATAFKHLSAQIAEANAAADKLGESLTAAIRLLEAQKKGRLTMADSPQPHRLDEAEIARAQRQAGEDAHMREQLRFMSHSSDGTGHAPSAGFSRSAPVPADNLPAAETAAQNFSNSQQTLLRELISSLDLINSNQSDIIAAIRGAAANQQLQQGLIKEIAASIAALSGQIATAKTYHGTQ